jgi:hypothetical protein
MSEPTGEDLDTCANCGASLGEVGRWYPTAKVETEAELSLFAFCDSSCRTQFREEGG